MFEGEDESLYVCSRGRHLGRRLAMERRILALITAFIPQYCPPHCLNQSSSPEFNLPMLSKTAHPERFRHATTNRISGKRSSNASHVADAGVYSCGVQSRWAVQVNLMPEKDLSNILQDSSTITSGTARVRRPSARGTALRDNLLILRVERSSTTYNMASSKTLRFIVARPPSGDMMVRDRCVRRQISFRLGPISPC
jgi:hypothetical protein